MFSHVTGTTRKSFWSWCEACCWFWTSLQLQIWSPLLLKILPFLLLWGTADNIVFEKLLSVDDHFVFLSHSVGKLVFSHSFLAMTQQTGKLRVVNVKAETAVFDAVVTYLCQQKRAKGYQRLVAMRDSSRAEQEIMSHLCHLIATYLQLWGRPPQIE